jgi:glycosyltransferase involved in cell wall biosynthesis
MANTDHFAIVSETYPPEVNGVALTVQSLELGLRSLGHRVEVIRPAQSDATAAQTDHLLVRGAGLPRYPGLRFGLPSGRTLLQRWQVQRPRAIYVATEGPLGWSAVRVANRLGIPAATGFHTRFDDYVERYGAGWLRPAVFRWMRHFHNSAQATLVPTQELSDFLRAQGFEHVRLLRRAVDTQLFNPTRRRTALRQQWGLADGAPALIYVGRIAAEKNLSLAIRAFRTLQATVPAARFIWVGDGPERQALAEANPDFVFCGVQRGEALAEHFASGDLFVFPSLTETFGNVTLEAMASGIATVAYHYGAAREHLLDGAHGASVVCGDEEAFIEAVGRLAADAERCLALGRTARTAIEHLSPQSVSEHFAELLQSLPWRAAA